jgi:3-phenylpropionate/trans-cinnamate dioxygenase ferredoxin reductase subunit
MGTDTIVIVGAGLTAGKAAEGLRDSGWSGRVVVVGAEHHLPYERPPLSKGYLMDHDKFDSVFVHPPEWYDEYDIDLRLGTVASDLDLEAHTVRAGDETIGWDRLLLATGARPRRMPLVDDSGAPAAYLRTIEDSDRLKAELRPGRRIVVIGGGWIGLEVTAAARSAGCEVSVLEMLEKPLIGVLGPEVADIFADLHVSHGVDLRTGVAVSAVERREDADGERGVVRLADGSSVQADLIVVGVGVAPATELAEAAGLTVDNGIVVDDRLRTSHPDVFAAGDVANAFHPLLARHLRVEHWDNAIEQGLTAARTMLGSEESYTRLPYFFTDQYDLGMEYVGYVGPEGYDEVVLRGDPAERLFTAFWLRGGQVQAGMHVNDWDAIDPIREVVGSDRVNVAALRDAQASWDDITS